MWFWFIIKSILYLPFRIFYPTRIINARELKKYRGKGVVFCCNHRSNMDGVALYFYFWRKKRFLAKPSLFDTKFKSSAMRALSCYPVERGKDLSLIKFSMEMLKKNHAIVMFPEGMRAFSPEDALALRNGAAMIAIKGGVPIVPMVFRRAPRPFVFNALKVGTAISTENYQGRKLEKSDLAEVSGKIQTAMTQLLDGFGTKRKPKWWQTQDSVISRGIVITDNKLLLVKRVREGQEFYVFPGGHIDSGETPRDAVVREVREETNVETAPIRMLYKYLHKGKLESFYTCAYKSGTVSTTDAEEYTGANPTGGTYEPVSLPIDEIEKIDLRPTAIRDQLCKDIKKYGINLARVQKYVK